MTKTNLKQMGQWLCAALWMVGCASNTDSSTTSGTSAAEGDEMLHGELPKDFTVFPSKIWIGFDGMNMYKGPVTAVSNKGNVTWTIADPTIASLDPASTDPKAKAGGVNLMITALKPGTTTIMGNDGHTTQTATLEVIQYPYAQWQAGKKRYETAADDKNPACTKCHAPGKGPDHTPTELDADTDEEIRNTFVTGKDPEGRPVNYEHDFDNLLEGYTHEWKVTEDEKVGLVAYLRSLKPLAFPEWDTATTEK